MERAPGGLSRKVAFSVVLALWAGICVLLFVLVFRDAKRGAVDRLNERHRIHARQAASGIEDYFRTWTSILSSLARIDEVAAVSADGRAYLDFFHEAHRDQLLSITRVGENGVILYTVPGRSSIGRDLSAQPHIRRILSDRRPVVSDVFPTVQGGDGIAIHVPVFRGGEFRGTVAAVVNFRALAKRYLEVIRVGRTGSAWVVSQDGTMLYSPVPSFIGKPLLEAAGNDPSFLALAKEMIRGGEGVAAYTFDRIGGERVAPFRSHAFYSPIRLGTTFWSVAVSSSEEEVNSSLLPFRNRLLLVMGAVLLGGVVLSATGAKAWLIVREEEKRLQVEEQLRQSQKMEALGSMAGGVAHDFNNALTVILGCASLLRKRLKGDERNEALAGEIVASVERASEMTRSLLAFSRKQATTLQSGDLEQVASGLEKSLRRLIREDVELRYVPCGRPLPALLDRSQVEQVIVNLVVNARDAMPSGGVLTISTSMVGIEGGEIGLPDGLPPGAYCVLEVADTGVGMDPATRERIFEPFFTTKGPGEGTGLGLSIVYGIVARHGGRVHVYSEKGRGTTFRVYFPVERGEAAPEPVPHEPDPPRGNGTVLLVEDEEAVREITARILSEHGYRVMTSPDGEAGATAYLENREAISLVVTDLVMPKRNGRQMVEEIRRRGSDVPVIYMSGYPDDMLAAGGIGRENSVYLQKPVKPDVLLAAAHELTRRQE